MRINKSFIALTSSDASVAWSNITGTPTTLSGYGITDGVPTSRTLTINGVTYDLSANRTWTISTGTVTSVALATGTTGTNVNITGSPITSSGTITINIPDAATTARGLVTTGTQTIGGEKTFRTDNGLPLTTYSFSSATSTISTLFRIQNFSSGTTANGFGAAIEYYIETDANLGWRSNRIISKWSNAANASRTSEFVITGVSSTTEADLFTLAGSGALKLNKYGVNAFIGTPAYSLAVDALGNVIESTFTNGTVTGSGTQNYITKWNNVGGTAIGNSLIYDNGSHVGIGSTNPNRTGYDANGRTLTLYGPQRSALELGSETPVNSTQLGAVNFLSSTTVKAQIISDLDGSGNANLVFSLAGSSRAVITPNGRLLLGTTTEGSELLQVNGTSRFTNNITIDDTGTAVLSAQGNVATNFFINSRSTLTFQTGGAYGSSTTRLTIGSTGAATFSSTLGINGVSDNVKSGTYTPTLTNIANISTNEAFVCNYTRIDTIVTVFGSLNITPTSASITTTIGVSLPIASNFGNYYDAWGVFSTTDNTINGGMDADTTNDRINMTFTSVGTGTKSYYFSFSYRII